MAKRVFSSAGITMTATAVAVQATANQYFSLVGANATQTFDILECEISGTATNSAVLGTMLARQVTLGTGGPNALAANFSDGPSHPATAALAAPVVTASSYVTNQSIPSSAVTDAHLNLVLNAFGGILRWNAAPTQQITCVGNAAPGGSAILWNSSTSAGTTTTASAHIIYEPY
jgi:hypothetical protein